MILVVDTNILFSFFWKNSLIRKILTFSEEKFISPEIAFIELKKYSALIINKTLKNINLAITVLRVVINNNKNFLIQTIKDFLLKMISN